MSRPASVAASLCYSGDPLKSFGGFDGSGVHLTLDSHTTLCGRRVIDVPTVPRPVEPLSCRDCYEADHARMAARLDPPDVVAVEYDGGRKDYDDPRVCQNCVRTEGSYRATLAYSVLNSRTGKYHASPGYGQSNCGLDMTGDQWLWPV